MQAIVFGLLIPVRLALGLVHLAVLPFEGVVTTVEHQAGICASYEITHSVDNDGTDYVFQPATDLVCVRVE